MSDETPILYDVDDGVATLTFNRPEALNAIDFATTERLKKVALRAATSPEVRAVLLTGALFVPQGRHWIARDFPRGVRWRPQSRWNFSPRAAISRSSPVGARRSPYFSA